LLFTTKDFSVFKLHFVSRCLGIFKKVNYNCLKHGKATETKFNFSINFVLMLKRTFLFYFLLLCSGLVNAQDLHFSQFFNSPLNLNPALAGVFNGDYRIVANHKNQWRTVPVAYRTYSIAADGRLPIKLKKDIISCGLLLNNDKAGDGAFYTNQLGLSLSYLKRLNQDSTSFLSIGIQPSFVSKGFNLSKLSYDNQFSDGTYDAAIAASETYNSTKIQYLDWSTGLNFLQKIGSHSSVNIGLSYHHLQKQNISFMSDNKVVSNPKYLIHSSIVLGINNGFELIPVGLYQLQNKNKEIVAGLLFRMIFENKADNLRAFTLGGMLRYQDAFIVDAQLDYNRFRFGISYDITTSDFRKANSGLGGFELSLIYIMKRFVRVQSNKIVCPVFL